jgi:hypothetical protein
MDAGMAKESWLAFTGLLGDAADVLDWPGLELDDLDRAEGLRYLARMVEVGVAAQLGTESSRHPAFRTLSNGFGMDNPDNHYIGSPVDPRLEYRVTGRVGSLSYMSFAAQNQNFAKADQITGGAGHLHARELVTRADGSFEIVASQREHDGNWLRFAEDTTLLLARQTRADPATEDWVDLRIERLDGSDAPPPLEPSRVADRLAMVAWFTIGAPQWFVQWVTPWLERPNQFALSDPEEQRRVGGDPNILSQSGYWTLGPEESLRVEFEPPRCAYWNIQLANVWAESLDVRRPVWRNHTTATVDDDGVARFVVAHRDPGVANWLDTAGHRHGLMHIRFVDSDGWPLATTRLVEG